jgi:hypothetical protein
VTWTLGAHHAWHSQRWRFSTCGQQPAGTTQQPAARPGQASSCGRTLHRARHHLRLVLAPGQQQHAPRRHDAAHAHRQCAPASRGGGAGLLIQVLAKGPAIDRLQPPAASSLVSRRQLASRQPTHTSAPLIIRRTHLGTAASTKKALAASALVTRDSGTSRVPLSSAAPGSLKPMWPVWPMPRICGRQAGRAGQRRGQVARRQVQQPGSRGARAGAAAASAARVRSRQPGVRACSGASSGPPAGAQSAQAAPPRPAAARRPPTCRSTPPSAAISCSYCAQCCATRSSGTLRRRAAAQAAHHRQLHVPAHRAGPPQAASSARAG